VTTDPKPEFKDHNNEWDANIGDKCACQVVSQWTMTNQADRSAKAY